MALRIRVSGGVAALATALACAGPAVAATVTVTTKADDLTPNDGSVSLREAITSVNAGNTLGDPDISNQNPGTYGTNDTIHFSIPLPPIPTISPASALPSITKRVLIDGTTQSGTGLYRVALDGTSAGAGVNGFNAIAPIEVLGFDIEHFSAAGIHLGHSFFGTSSAGSVIGENEIATNPAGTAAAGNQSGVVADSPSGNIVLNVISGNGTGVVLNSDHNRVAENYIGLDAAGSAAVPNGTGVSVSGADNRIGDQGGRNVISGNASNGVFVTGSTNFIQSNFIGTDAGGTKPIPNGAAGVFLFGPLGVRPRTVSGTPGDPQRIWFNTGPGIHDGVPGDRLSANSIK